MKMFLELRCNNCGKTTLVFEAATETIKCECGTILAKPTGGRIKIIDAIEEKRIKMK